MQSFSDQLATYKSLIDDDISAYSQHVRQATRQQYGAAGAMVTDAFLDTLEQDGKRIRGALVMTGYEMCGGTDRAMIVRAATALEMIHTHLLIVDDIQDRSPMRRGKPTVHERLARYHRAQQWRGDDQYSGVSLALNSALGGNAAALMLLAGLQVDAELVVKVLGIVNLTIATTGQGQTQDLVNTVTSTVSMQDVRNAMEWKTAHYTLLNPLCVGMVLAGAGCEDTDAIREYALAAGQAFQIVDDIIGTFGEDRLTGKSAMDDVREGKQTLLTAYALEHASKQQVATLRNCLGNPQLTPEAFNACKTIIIKSGARTYAQDQAERYCNQALHCLEREGHRWRPTNVAFLKALTEYLLRRER